MNSDLVKITNKTKKAVADPATTAFMATRIRIRQTISHSRGSSFVWQSTVTSYRVITMAFHNGKREARRQVQSNRRRQS